MGHIWLVMMAALVPLVGMGCSSPAFTPVPTPTPPTSLPVKGFVDSSPVDGATYARMPVQVLINFDFQVSPSSSIKVTRDSELVQIGETTIGGLHNLSLAALLPNSAEDERYMVTYTTCRNDGSCEEGRFAFVVDRGARSAYADLTTVRDVAVDMRGVAFAPARIIVARNTTVTWTNRDPVVHFVNTDPHPSHNNLPGLNSQEVKPGDVYSFTFREAGEWRYHCSAHQNMVGNVLVE